VRKDVEEGSKAVAAGVNRALRFCVIESSIEALDMRRKSARALAIVDKINQKDIRDD
jgi:hypothetical protein